MLSQKTCIYNESIFKFELCTFPPTLFDSSGLLLQANKASLADFLWNEYMTSQLTPFIQSNVQYVIGGGALLYPIPWSNGQGV